MFLVFLPGAVLVLTGRVALGQGLHGGTSLVPAIIAGILTEIVCVVIVLRLIRLPPIAVAVLPGKLVFRTERSGIITYDLKREKRLQLYSFQSTPLDWDKTGPTGDLPIPYLQRWPMRMTPLSDAALVAIHDSLLRLGWSERLRESTTPRYFCRVMDMAPPG